MPSSPLDHDFPDADPSSSPATDAPLSIQLETWFQKPLDQIRQYPAIPRGVLRELGSLSIQQQQKQATTVGQQLQRTLRGIQLLVNDSNILAWHASCGLDKRYALAWGDVFMADGKRDEGKMETMSLRDVERQMYV